MVSDIVKVAVMVGLAGFFDPFVIAELYDDRDFMFSAMKICAEKHEVPKDDIEKLFPHPLAHGSDDNSIVIPDIKCYLACIMEEPHIIMGRTVNWVRAEEVMAWGITDEEHRYELHELLKKLCKNKDFFKDPKDSCDPGYKLAACIYLVQKTALDQCFRPLY